MKKLVLIIGLIVALLALGFFVYPRYLNDSPVKVDNISKLIEEKYPNSKKHQMALKQKAEWMIRLANGDTSYDQISTISDKASNCLSGLFPEQASEDGRWIEEVVFDTPRRWLRYEKYNHHFSGKIISFEIVGIKDCNFDPSSLSN